MFDIAWSELALIALVALIVIGPKDLPKVMRSMGQWIRRARSMAAEFQRNVDEMMRETELHDLKKEVESVSTASFKAKMEAMIDVDAMEKAMRMTPDPAAPAEPPQIEPPTTPGTAPEPGPADKTDAKP